MRVMGPNLGVGAFVHVDNPGWDCLVPAVILRGWDDASGLEQRGALRLAGICADGSWAIDEIRKSPWAFYSGHFLEEEVKEEPNFTSMSGGKLDMRRVDGRAWTLDSFRTGTRQNIYFVHDRRKGPGSESGYANIDRWTWVALEGLHSETGATIVKSGLARDSLTALKLLVDYLDPWNPRMFAEWASGSY